MIKITHPHAAWSCSGCSDPIVDAVACGTCYALLCPVCAALTEHVIPAGERAGKPCPSGRAAETAQAA